MRDLKWPGHCVCYHHTLILTSHIPYFPESIIFHSVQQRSHVSLWGWFSEEKDRKVLWVDLSRCKSAMKDSESEAIVPLEALVGSLLMLICRLFENGHDCRWRGVWRVKPCLGARGISVFPHKGAQEEFNLSDPTAEFLSVSIDVVLIHWCAVDAIIPVTLRAAVCSFLQWLHSICS